MRNVTHSDVKSAPGRQAIGLPSSQHEANTDGDEPRLYWRLNLHVTRLDEERLSAAKGEAETRAGVPFPTPRGLAIHQHVARVAAGVAEAR